MEEHKFILFLFLSAAVLVAGIFHFLYSTTLNPPLGSEGLQSPLKKRGFMLVFMFIVFVILLFVTIPKSPYFLFSNETPAKVVYVNAQQFAYMMSYKSIDINKPEVETDIDLPLNEPIEFRVTSTDVTHGFGIYNSKAELLIQTQAMPGYVNRLRWKFTEPGKYNILCLEFCGSGHAVMRSSFIVK